MITPIYKPKNTVDYAAVYFETSQDSIEWLIDMHIMTS